MPRYCLYAFCLLPWVVASLPQVIRGSRVGPGCLFIFALAFTSGLWGGLPLAAESQPLTLPIAGERLTYKLYWGPLTVGSAVLETKGPVTFEETPTYQFVFTIKTNRVTDIFYKLRSEYVGYGDITMSRSLHFTKKEQHNRRKRDVVVNFDWEAKKAQYANFGKTREPITLTQETYDPLSAIFAARLKPIPASQEVELPVTDGKRYGEIALRVVDTQRVRVSAGIFETLFVQLDLAEISADFKDGDSIKIWVSDDAYRVPVKMVGKVKWGSFRAELVSVQRPEIVADG